MEMTSIGPYRIERQLSRGGLSRVYEATDTRDGRQIAIKVATLPRDEAGRASFTELFRTETKVLASLRHPAVTAILDEGITQDGTPYFVMEYVHGRDLDRILDAEGRLPVEAALKVARQVAGALGAAHAEGYLHRDVKPGNILVLTDEGVPPWTVKLLDFGVTERVDDRTQQTRGGDYFGSVRYMSPEQIRAQPISTTADVWALGVTLYEMLVGQPPFAGKGMAAAMAEIMNADVRIPPEIELPEPVVAFLRRCLAKDEAMRPANGTEAEANLARLEDGLRPADRVARVPVSLLPAPGSFVIAEPPPVPAYAADPLAQTIAAPWERAVEPNDPLARTMVATTRRTVRPFGWGVLLAAAATVCLIFLFFLRTHQGSDPGGVSRPPFPHPGGSGTAWWGVLIGFGLLLGGVLIGNWVRGLLASKTSAISYAAQAMLSGARSRDELSRTMAIQVDEIAAQCRLADERFLATSMAIMVDEYGASTTFDDRQKALMNAVTLLEKLNAKLSPWYVRYDKLIAFGVTLVGVVSGLVTIAQNVAKLIKGS